MLFILIKHVKDIDTEDEYIKVDKDDIVLDVVIRMQKPVECNLETEDYMCTPILAAYVMEGKKALGVIYQDDIIEEIILNGKDPKTLKAKDIMKPPVVCNLNQEVAEVVNLIMDKGLYTVAICDGERLISVISVYDAVFLYQDLNDI